ncbi:MAG: hypothetical protein V4736_10405 [Bdellovibrionota bacterium]
MGRLLLALLFPILASAQASGPVPASAYKNFPNSAALTVWREAADEISLKLDLNKYPTIPVKCSAEGLIPAFPQQDTKLYHQAYWNQYDANLLKPTDYPCKINNLKMKGNACLRPDTANYLILSDIYEDSCGNLYRGFAEISYLKGDESMGTLVAPGKTIYKDPKSEFANMFIYGGTHKVPIKRFIKIGPVFKSDLPKVPRLKEQALKTHSYDAKTKLYKEL